MKSNYAAIILAAGYSSRMKSFKPLLPVGEITAVGRSVLAVTGADIKEIAVVTGHNRALITPKLDEISASFDVSQNINVFEAHNPEFDKGMFSSIKAGIAAIRKQAPETEGIFLMPADCPLISSDVISEVMQRANDSDFCVPVFKGKKGHPLFIPKKYFDEICDHDGPGGLKAITDKYWDKMIRVPVEEEGCIMDMDTPEGYEEIKHFLEAGCKRAPLHELAKGRRIFFVRHGQTRQHDEKMFIGRYDVPLAAGAEKDIAEMAEKLREEIHKEEARQSRLKIYTSPLLRAKQTAEIIKEVLGTVETELCIEEALQEISLGEWDGRSVREIKEQYPAEYERRGNDLFAFKTGNRAENFYDVQYRAVKALRKILKADSSRDIVIVSHSAVIRALENNLKAMQVDDYWDPVDKCSYRTIEP